LVLETAFQLKAFNSSIFFGVRQERGEDGPEAEVVVLDICTIPSYSIGFVLQLSLQQQHSREGMRDKRIK